MDNKRKIAILIYLHVRKETSKLEEQEIAAWRKESPGNEKLYLKLTDMEWVNDYIRAGEETNERCEKAVWGDGERPPSDKTLQELHQEDLAKWPHSKLEYWLHEMEVDEPGEYGKLTTIREYFEMLLDDGGLLNTARDRRMAALLFLHVRKETSKREEKEISDWRSESSKNDLIYLQLTDKDHVNNVIEWYENAYCRMREKMSAKYPNLTKGKTLQEEHEETITSQTRYTRLEYWIHELEDFDKRTDPPIRKIRKKRSTQRKIFLPVKFINWENI